MSLKGIRRLFEYSLSAALAVPGAVEFGRAVRRTRLVGRLGGTGYDYLARMCYAILNRQRRLQAVDGRDLHVRAIMDTSAVRTKPFFDRIRTIGHQPFIQIGIQSELATEFVICHTQQELAKFADALGALPQRRNSPFLAGLHAAMSLEFYDAGQHFFRWCLRGDDGVALEVLDFSQAEAPLAFPLDFPAFVVFDPSIATASRTAADRADGL